MNVHAHDEGSARHRDRGAPLERPGQILVADDDDAFRDSISALIRDRGFEVRSVADACEGLEALASGWGDVVIADLNMPGNVNLEFFEQVRKSGSVVGLILVTGYPSFGTAQRSLHLGVTNYLVKPFDFDDLCEQIEIALREVAVIRYSTNISNRLKALGQELSGLTSGTLATAEPGKSGSAVTVLDLIFDRVIGILLDLKRELSTASGPDATEGGDSGILRSAIASVAHNDALFQSSEEYRSLSPREREVMLSLISGNRVATIARDLFISQFTVRNHLKSIFGKLNVRSQVELLERFKAKGRHA